MLSAEESSHRKLLPRHPERPTSSETNNFTCYDTYHFHQVSLSVKALDFSDLPLFHSKWAQARPSRVTRNRSSLGTTAAFST